MYHRYPVSQQLFHRRGRRARRGATARIVFGTVWMLAAGLATTAGVASRADEGNGRNVVSGALPDMPEKADPQRETVPTETVPVLVPPPATSPIVATEEGANSTAEMLPPPKPESFAPAPRGVGADDDAHSGNSIDPGIRPIGSVTVNIALPPARDDESLQLSLPKDAASEYFPEHPSLPSPSTTYTPWMTDNCYCPPLNFCYRPLFFEEVNLERYGYSWGLFQPAVSTAKFYSNVALLPYRLIAQHPCKCTYHDHHSRPGGPAPREIQVPKLPLSRLHMLKRKVLLK